MREGATNVAQHLVNLAERVHQAARSATSAVTSLGRKGNPKSMKKYTLYHGTCAGSAASLVRDGWSPHSGIKGAHGGQGRFLYLTNFPENAQWYAEERGCDAVVVVRDVPATSLRVDPEDGVADTVEEELSNAFGLPGSVVLTKPLDASHFSMLNQRKLKAKLLK